MVNILIHYWTYTVRAILAVIAK